MQQVRRSIRATEEPKGTALQAGRSRFWFSLVWLVFFSDIFFLAALWPWVRLSLL